MPSASDAIGLVIPFHNGSAYATEAIASALAQSVPFARIIIVDDGSSTPEHEFIARLAAGHGLTLVRQPNAGQGSARNRGIDELDTAWVCFLDQDDVLLPDHNALLLAAMHALPEPRGWVFGDYQLVTVDGTPIAGGNFPHRDMPVPTDVVGYLGRDLHMLPSASIYSRAALVAIGGHDVRFRGFEDDDLHIRLHLAGFTCRFLDEPVYRWRRHALQTSHSAVFIESAGTFVAKWTDHEFPAHIERSRLRRSIYDRWRRYARSSGGHRSRKHRLAMRRQIWTMRRLYPEFVGARELAWLLAISWVPGMPGKQRLLRVLNPRKRKGRH